MEEAGDHTLHNGFEFGVEKSRNSTKSTSAPLRATTSTKPHGLMKAPGGDGDQEYILDAMPERMRFAGLIMSSIRIHFWSGDQRRLLKPTTRPTR
jgi:hypothetical protein